MDFINRGFSSIIFIVLIFLTLGFLINVLPIILLIGIGVWGVNYTVKAFIGWNKSRKKVFKRDATIVEQVGVMKEDFSENFNAENAVDVEYTEIK